uniref:WD40 repeat-like protein n=1 Tax=Mycena chlorophos TaxID=658473 RepID=A0ABQ0KYD6_MYCCL|nr:predicted protein [Mycena chlorophos]
MFAPTSKSGNYVRHQVLHGHSGPIFSLLTTEDGRFLASGGSDGMRIWNLDLGEPVKVPRWSAFLAASTAVVWVKRDDSAFEMVISGTQSGRLVCWERKQNGHFEENFVANACDLVEVTGMAYDGPSNRLAVCLRSGVAAAYIVRPNGLTKIFAVDFGDHVVLKAAAFGKMYGDQKDIMVASLYSGDIFTLRGPHGEIVGEPWNIGTPIGDIAVDVHAGLICMDDPSSGLNLYRIDDRKRINSFPIEVTKKKRVRQIVFVENNVIAGTSDHGIVYLWDGRSAKIHDELKVSKGNWIQAVAACQQQGVGTIIAANSSNSDEPNPISVWRKHTKRPLGLGVTLCGVLVFVRVFCWSGGGGCFVLFRYPPLVILVLSMRFVQHLYHTGELASTVVG